MLRLKRAIDWPAVVVLVSTPIAALFLIPWHLHHYDLPSWAIPMMILCMFATGMSITAGYHRLLAHRSYETNTVVKIIFLLIGAATWQGTALKWCSEHRRHHRLIDTDDDPYSARKGFFYSHIGWLFLMEDEKYKGQYESDLRNDRWVYFQHRFYVPIAVMMGLGVPTLIGWVMGDALVGFVYLGLGRMVWGHHTTFLVNSAAHFWGFRPYSEKITARDSVVVALMTYGEGYHNYHHTFEGDYRNGIRWYHWDPTKWLIRSMAHIRMAKRLNKVPDSRILNAKILTERMRLEQKGLANERVQQLYKQIEKAQAQWRELKVEYAQEYAKAKQQFEDSNRARIRYLKAELKLAKREFRHAQAQWRIVVRSLESIGSATPA